MKEVDPFMVPRLDKSVISLYGPWAASGFISEEIYSMSV